MTVSEERKRTYAGILLLKLMDLSEDEGGMTFPRELPPELTPLEGVFDELRFRGYVEIGKVKRQEVFKLSKAGLAHLGQLIDEAAAYVEEYDELEIEEIVTHVKQRRLDPMRFRFLWGWYIGEFDDLVLFQQQRGVEPVEELWAYYLTSDEFFDEIAHDLEA